MTKEFKYPFKVNTVTGYNGCEIAYVDEGAGAQTILWVHGLATYSMSWKKNIEKLKHKYRCIAIDLPGNGLSGKGDYPYDMPFFAHTLVDFIGRLGLKNVCIAGHSMGGQIAMSAVLAAPSCADKLVLCAPAGFETFNAMESTGYRSAISFFDMFSTEENSLRHTVHASFFQHTHQADGMINELIALMKTYPRSAYKKMIDACIKGMLHSDVFEHLGEIKQPTLVLFGERDGLIPNRLIHPVTTRQIALDGVNRMQNATLEMIPQCGHFLQIEKADKTNDLISTWLG